jgi:hypothetical protein
MVMLSNEQITDFPAHYRKLDVHAPAGARGHAQRAAKMVFPEARSGVDRFIGWYRA